MQNFLAIAEAQRILELHKAGKSVREIVQACGRSKGSVWRVINGRHKPVKPAKPRRFGSSGRITVPQKWRRSLANMKAQSTSLSRSEETVARPVTLLVLRFMTMKLSWE